MEENSPFEHAGGGGAARNIPQGVLGGRAGESLLLSTRAR